jgi:hypothetical protein
MITFEDLGVAPGTQLNPPAGVGVVSGGFNYTPGPNNASGFNDLHMGNALNVFPYNGTTVGVTHDDVVLTQVGGGSFSLQAFDFAGWPNGSEITFTVTGVRADATTITQTFTPDGLVDGQGGVPDYQTFAVTGDWTNLVSVTWVHSGPGTTQGLFGLDNIVVNESAEVVPEPASLALFGLGLAGVAGFGRRRKPAAA